MALLLSFSEKLKNSTCPSVPRTQTECWWLSLVPTTLWFWGQRPQARALSTAIELYGDCSHPWPRRSASWILIYCLVLSSVPPYTCLLATLRWKAAPKRRNPTRHHSVLSFPILFYVKFFCFKEIKPVNPKGSQLWIFTGRTAAEAEAPILWQPDAKNWKRPWCWERLRAGGKGDDRGWDGWMASPTQWTWVCANSSR